MGKDIIIGEGRQCMGNASRQIEDRDKSNPWKWLRKSNLKGCTETLNL